MSILDEPPPFEEQALVGGLLRDSTAWSELSQLVDPRDFSDWRCRTLYSAMLAVYMSGSTVDEHSARKQLIADDTFDSIGGGPFVFACYDRVPNGHSVALYASRVTEVGRLRRLTLSLKMTCEKIDRGEFSSTDEAIAAAGDIAKQFESQVDARFKTYSMAELDAAEFSTDYLVDGVLVAGQPCVMAAGKKTLKTNIACDLTLSLASGSQFIGQFWTPRAVRVAMMTGESGDATTQETMRRIARSKPWKNLADYTNAICSFDLPRLGQPQTKRELERFITDNGLQVLILDPAYLCLDLGADAGNLFIVGKKLRELTDIGHATGCTIIIIHHNTKSPFKEPFSIPELESIAWSGFQEWARQWLLIGRRELYNAERAGSHRLWLNVGGSAGHSGCWAVDIEEGSRKDEGGRRWEVRVQVASSAVAENNEQRETAKEQKCNAKLEGDCEKLLEVYQKYPQGETAKFIREASRLNSTRFDPANQKLVDDGLIEACRIKKHTREENAFRLRTSDAGTGGTGGTVPEQIPPVPAGCVVVELPPCKGGVHPPPPPHSHRNEFTNSSGKMASQFF